MSSSVVEDNVPGEYRDAVVQAKNLLALSYYSEQSLIDQLTIGYGTSFSPEAAQYAVQHADADWNEEAVQAAKAYRNYTIADEQKIFNQLSSPDGDKFTEEQARYAVEHMNDE